MRVNKFKIYLELFLIMKKNNIYLVFLSFLALIKLWINDTRARADVISIITTLTIPIELSLSIEPFSGIMSPSSTTKVSKTAT